MYNKLFENLDQNEQNAAKFAFSEISAYSYAGFNCELLKLNANGTTGYPVYYLYMSYQRQGYVLRILKQGRKCKLLSFGNPKIVWAFVGDTNSKMPKREHATLEKFTALLNTNTSFAANLVKWLNEKLDGGVKLEDFGVKASSYTSANTSTSVNTSKPVSTISASDLFAKRDKFIKNKLKKDFAKEKASTNTISKNIIELDPYFWYDDDKVAATLWNSLTDFQKDFFYNYQKYLLDFPGYTRSVRTDRCFGGSYDSSYTIVKKVVYTGKPCKEFNSLNTYLTNVLKVNALKVGDIKAESLEGKRSTIFERSTFRELAFMPERCIRIKSELQKLRKSNWKATMKLDNATDYGDRYNSYGEDRECEWDGVEENYAVIYFKTPTGKDVTSYAICCYGQVRDCDYGDLEMQNFRARARVKRYGRI